MDIGVVDESVDDGGCDGFIVEDCSPFAKGAVGGNDD